jgi:hypothetical protein
MAGCACDGLELRTNLCACHFPEVYRGYDGLMAMENLSTAQGDHRMGGSSHSFMNEGIRRHGHPCRHRPAVVARCASLRSELICHGNVGRNVALQLVGITAGRTI